MRKEYKAPFFIIGTERSGTNLLRLLLNTHSHITIPHPPHIMKNFFRLEPLYGDLSVDVNFKKLIIDVVKMVELHPYPWEVRLDKEKIFREARERNLISIFFCAYNQHLESTHKIRWGCKSTFMIYHVALIRHYYPLAKFIYMVRDGRDVAASAKKSIFNRYCVYYTANLWKKEQQIGMYWLSALSQDNIILVKYEDILRNPAEAVKSVCFFLDEPYEENMLNFFHTEEAKKSGSISISWANTSKSIMKSNFNKFNTELKESEIRLFEAIAGEELGYFSYQLTQPFYISEGARARGIRFKIRYALEEIYLFLKAQVSHFIRDKNNLLRFKKFWFLKLAMIMRVLR